MVQRGTKLPVVSQNSGWSQAQNAVVQHELESGGSWPIPVRPRNYDARMIAQSAAFTYHAIAPESPTKWECPQHKFNGSKWVPFEPPGSIDLELTQVVVPAEFKVAVLGRLAAMNITEASLFPGLDGLGRMMRSILGSGSGRLNMIGRSFID